MNTYLQHRVSMPRGDIFTLLFDAVLLGILIGVSFSSVLQWWVRRTS